MRVAIITNSATTHSGARAPVDLANNLRKFCEVILFAQNKGLNKSIKNIKVIPYQSAFYLYKYLKKEGCDLISFHSSLPQMIAAKITGIPLVKTYYGTQFNAYLEKFLPDEKISILEKLINLFANWYIWLNQKIQLILSNQIVAISKAAQAELHSIFNTNSKLIYLGSNLKPTPYHPTIPPSHHPLTILSVSRITPYKGFHQLIDAVKNIRKEGTSVKLIIAGSGEKKNYLQYLRKIKDPRDQIIVSPSDQTLKGLYRQCDIVASCDRYPFFGLSLLEAAQFAKPVVVLNHHAANELVLHDKTGYVANSKEELKKYIITLLKNKDKRLKMGNSAQIYAQQKFNWTKIASSYSRIFQKSAKHKKSPKYSMKTKILLVILGIISSLTILEIYARLIIAKTYTQTLPSFFQENPDSIVALKPNTTRILKSKKSGEFTTIVNINSQGLRSNYNYELPKPANTYRI